MTRRRRAFTLVELAVTLLLMAIVAAATAFIGTRIISSANGVDGQGRINRVVIAQEQVAHDMGSFTPYAKDIQISGNDFTILENGAVSLEADQISMAVNSDGQLGLAVWADNTCFTATSTMPQADGDVTYGQLDMTAANGSCSSVNALSQDGLGTTLVAYTAGGSLTDQF